MAEAVTAVVLMGKVAVLVPAATVTGVETVAQVVFPLVTTTAMPPVGALPVNVTVPVDKLPPTTVEGLRVSVVGTGGLTVSVVVLVTPLLAAEIVTLVEAATGIVVTVKVAVLTPAATVTVAGTLAAALLLESVMTLPPEGALPVRVTVPVVDTLPKTLLGLSETEDTAGAWTVKVAVLVTPPVAAEIVDVALEVVGKVVIVNSAKVALAATVTVVGTVATVGLLLLKVTTVPPVGAALFNVILPVLITPPATDDGVNVNNEAVCA